MSIEPISPIIAVPARNEEERLPLLLAALAAQNWHSRNEGPLKVIIVLNNCTDNSHDAVITASRKHPALEISLLDVAFEPCDAHVGSARRLAMETALAACAVPAHAAILTTDADAAPRYDWVTSNLRHLASGIDLVGGLIVGNPDEEERLGPEFNRRAQLHQRYSHAVDRLDALINPLPHDPWPRHCNHTGASLAVRADIYRAVGGLPALPFREDIALVERVGRAGYLIRHPHDVVVEVSARLVGRAPGGMADCLAKWVREAASHEPLLVEHPEEVFERISCTRRSPFHVAVSSESAFSAFASENKINMLPAEEAIEMLAAMIERAGGSYYAA